MTRKAFKIITCSGDLAKEEVLQECLEYFEISIFNDVYEKGIRKNVIFANLNNEYSNSEETVIIPTDMIPIGWILEFPTENFVYKSLIFNSPVDKMLIFASFPYRKRDIVSGLLKVLKIHRTLDAEVVLLRTEKRFAATDIVSFSTTVELAEKDFRKIADKVTFYETGGDFAQFYDINFPLSKNMYNQYVTKIDKALKKFYREFDYIYKATLGIDLKTSEVALGVPKLDIEELQGRVNEIYNYFLKDIADGKFFVKKHYNNQQLREILFTVIEDKLLAINGKIVK